jgi:hypothetical protein
MFDPFFLPMLVLGPISLAYLVRNELRRTEDSLRPDGLSILLAVLAAFGLREWILLVGLPAFDDRLEQHPPADIRAYGLWIATLVVVVSYFVVARVRSKRNRHH